MSEFILPVTVPGATEAAAQMRTFKVQSAEAAVAADAAGKAAHTLGSSLTVSATSAGRSTGAIKTNTAALVAEAAAAKHASQAHANLNAIRSAARAVGGERLSRSIQEGNEAAGGKGFLSKGGFAAAAGVGIGAMIGEMMGKEQEIRLDGVRQMVGAEMQMVQAIEAGVARLGELGKGEFQSHGDTARALAAAGGPELLKIGNALRTSTGDDKADSAFAELVKKFGASGSGLDAAKDLAIEGHRLGLGSFSSIAAQLNPERMGRGSTDDILSELSADGDSGRISQEELDSHRANIARSTVALAPYDAAEAAAGSANANGPANIKHAATGMQKQILDGRVPAAAELTAKFRLDAEGEVLKAAAMEEKQSLGGALFHALGWTENAMDKWRKHEEVKFKQGEMATRDMQRQSNDWRENQGGMPVDDEQRGAEQAEAARQATEHLRMAAEHLDRVAHGFPHRGGGRHQGAGP